MRQHNNNNNNNNSNNRNRTRGRGRKSGNSTNRNFESNGPDVKIRGNASHIAEKYLNLARDALTSGDPVMAENYFQHAEHYNRIVALAQANNPNQQPVKSGDDNRNNTGDDNRSNNGSGPQPEVDGAPAEVAVAEGDEAESAGEDNASSNKRRPRGNGASKPKQDASESDAEEVSSDTSNEEAEEEVVEAKPRSRNRRPRARKDDNISDDAAKLPGGLTAAPSEAEEEPVAAED